MSTADLLLAGDIGGTKTILALFEVRAGGLARVGEERFASQGYARFDDLLGEFRERVALPELAAACLDVAGPVIDGRCRPTNLPWLLDERELIETLGCRRVKLLNDLEATAFGMLHLPAGELVSLNEGLRPPRHGNVAVIAAGTGLGEAYLYWDGMRHHPIATEGGHADFAPRTDEEVELLRYLRAKLGGRVSCERVLSGPGIAEIYAFLRDTGRYQEPSWLAERLAAAEDPSALVSEVAHDEREPLCVATLELFAGLYGAEAGNMALRALTYGGVYVGGGIAPKNLEFLAGGAFLRGFTDKGRFEDLMRSIDVRVSTNPRVALIGSAHYALRLCEAAAAPAA